jgi:hypothetical protein
VTEKNLLSIEMEMQELQEKVRAMCIKAGWREHEPGEGPLSGHEFPAYIALAHSELSEALEAYRDKIWSDTCTPLVHISTDRYNHHPGCSGKPHVAPKPIGVGPDLADVFIRLLDMCDLWCIDLVSETTRVMEYGWTREYRHGGREL